MNKKNYEVELRGNTRSYRSEFGRAITSNDKFNKSMRGLSQGATAIQGPMGGIASRISVLNSLFSSGAGVVAGFAAALAGVVAVGYKSLKVFNEYEKAQLRTEALVRATGNAAGFSAEQLQQQADSVALNTLASVQGITEAQNVLLTFKTVSGETFKQAVILAQDMAAVFGGTAKDKALQLGKALEDPVAGINALKRSGVSFTDSQRNVIRSMVEMGDVAGAQQIILSQLAGQVGGAGAAEAGGLAGSIDTLSQRWDELLLSFSESSSIAGGVKDWINGISYSLDFLRGKIKPTIEELEQELLLLEKTSNNSATRRGENAARAANALREKEKESIRDEILKLKAEQGDLDAINQLIEKRRAELIDIDQQLPSAKAKGIGRFGSGKSEKEELQKQKRRAAAELQEFNRLKRELEAAEVAHQETQKQIKNDAEQVATEQRRKEADKILSSLQVEYQRIYDEALTAEGKDAELATVRYNRKVDALNAEIALLREKGLLTEEIEAAHQEALKQLKSSNESNIKDINQREIDAVLEKYDAIREAALEANNQDLALAEFKHEKQVEEIEAELALLREKGLLTLEIEAEHKQALENLESTHQANINAIKDEAREEELQKEKEKRETLAKGYETLFDIMGTYFDGMQGKHAAFARVALSIGSALLDEEKRKSLQSIWANTSEAAMKAYNSMVGIPIVGPVLAEGARIATYAVGALAAAKVTGMAHSGMTNIPSEGTYLLDGNERIIAPEQNRDLSRFLQAHDSQSASSGMKVEMHNYEGVPVRWMTYDDTMRLLIGQSRNQASEMRSAMHHSSNMQPVGQR